MLYFLLKLEGAWWLSLRVAMTQKMGSVSAGVGLYGCFHFIVSESAFYLSFIGGVIIPSCVQMIEHVGQNWRELSVCFCAWALGIPLLILEGLVTRHWRWLGIVTSFTSLLSIGTYLWVLHISIMASVTRCIHIHKDIHQQLTANTCTLLYHESLRVTLGWFRLEKTNEQSRSAMRLTQC